MLSVGGFDGHMVDNFGYGWNGFLVAIKHVGINYMYSTCQWPVGMVARVGKIKFILMWDVSVMVILFESNKRFENCLST